MKTSFCTNVFRHQDMDAAVVRLAQMGYDGLEFWDQYLVQADIDGLSSLLRRNGIAVSQLCPYFDFVSGRERWEETLKVAERYVEWAGILDCRLIRVFTGDCGSGEASDGQWAAAVEGLRIACGMGAPTGVSFALEAHPGSLMDTSESTLRLLGEVGAANLGVNLQVPLGDEEVMESASKLADRVIHLHAHNWLGLAPGGAWGELTFLDSGDCDFAGFLGRLHQRGFDGYVSIEHGSHNAGRRDPFAVAEHEVRYLKGLFKTLGS